MKLLPSGSRNENGQFYGAGKVGFWWSSTNDPSGVKLFTRTLSNDKQEIIKFAANPKIGYIVHSPTSKIFIMTINEIKNYFNDRCDEIISLSERGDP